jgi:hypothetical protein
MVQIEDHCCCLPQGNLYFPLELRKVEFILLFMCENRVLFTFMSFVCFHCSLASTFMMVRVFSMETYNWRLKFYVLICRILKDYVCS